MALFEVKYSQASLNILDSEVGLVLKTHEGQKSMAKLDEVTGRTMLKAGELYTDPETSVIGIVFEDYDFTDYDEYPISVIEAGRVLKDRVSTEAQGKESDFKAQGLYLV